MNLRLLFWNILLKDMKTLLRDRQQLFALIIGFASAILTVGSIEVSIIIEKSEKEKAARTAQEKAAEEVKADPTGQDGAGDRGEGRAEEPKKPENPLEKATPSMLRWLVIICGIGVGWYASLFVLPLGFATFAGERERGTLEVMLATPVSDGLLYGFKTLGVTIPGILYSAVLLVLSLGYALIFHPGMLKVIPLFEVLLGTFLSVPFIVMLCGIHVSLGACCSVRAKTTQAAGMLLGGIITAIIFLISGVGALLFFTPAKGPSVSALMWFSQRHFILQFAIAFALFAACWAALYFVGRYLFAREKMLLA